MEFNMVYLIKTFSFVVIRDTDIRSYTESSFVSCRQSGLKWNGRERGEKVSSFLHIFYYRFIQLKIFSEYQCTQTHLLEHQWILLLLLISIVIGERENWNWRDRMCKGDTPSRVQVYISVVFTLRDDELWCRLCRHVVSRVFCFTNIEENN